MAVKFSNGTVLLIITSVVFSVTAADWHTVDTILSNEISNQTFPGCVALVANESKLLYLSAFGNFTYGLPAPASGSNEHMSVDTMFDLASLTKVIASTTAAMVLYQQGLLDLEMPVADASLLGPAYASNGKSKITVLNLLLHNSGYPPDPEPGYSLPAFGCPESALYHPAEVFTCQRRIYESLLNQTLATPVGAKYVYSDLSMITMMYIIGKLARTHNLVFDKDLLPDCVLAGPPGPWMDQCYYEAFVRRRVIDVLGLRQTLFLPPLAWWARIAPTWNDTEGFAPGYPYRHRVLQGQVSDENAYALGGIAGHAGLFSTATDLFTLLHRLLFADATDPWINQTTVQTFTTVYNASFSSRALGWDTNNYNISDYMGCGNLSSSSWTHTGYTGTEVCIDPVRKLITVLLTNRVYPRCSAESMDKIHIARQRFNNAVKAIVDGDRRVAI